jgi:2-oxoglutarate ferredoxin oxidoreductase subunit gamma
MENHIIIAGSGGQGILFLGRLLTYAGMIEGKEVTWFPSYGAEIRGGTANCTVIISDEMIGSPVISNPDFLIVMNRASYDRFSVRLKPGGILIYDSSLCGINSHRDDIKIIAVQASAEAASMKSTKSANMVLTGAFIAVSGTPGINSAYNALDEITPSHRKDSVNINKELILKGYNLLEDKKSSSF